MAAAARHADTSEQEYSEATRGVMRSLWRVINNEPQSDTPEEKFDPRELQRTLELVRQSIKAERHKVSVLQRRIAELEAFKEAYEEERLLTQELKADRDCWRGQAMMMFEYVPRR